MTANKNTKNTVLNNTVWGIWERHKKQKLHSGIDKERINNGSVSYHTCKNVLSSCQLKIGWKRAADIAILYGQDGSGIPVRGEIFFPRPGRPCATPTVLYNGYWVSSPEAKRPGRGADHPTPHLAPRFNKQ